MSQFVKGLLQNELSVKFADVTDFVVLEAKGVGGNENNEMRGVLKEKGVKLSVVRNAMMRRALEGLEMNEAIVLFEAGPCAVAYGGESVVDVAKEMEVWAKKLDGVVFKGAFVDGEAVDAEGAKALAKMPTRAELQATIVMLAKTPGANVAGAIAGPAGHIAGCVKSIIEKLEEAA
ncbi:MAG: 50S ribosomal protein L10 [Anaerohalosphaera sp.]|nr:50S ribosomal protein L10 [Anaerohalosphaera sp.]